MKACFTKNGTLKEDTSERDSMPKPPKISTREHNRRWTNDVRENGKYGRFQVHRTDGPAFEAVGGVIGAIQEWYINGEHIKNRWFRDYRDYDLLL